MKIEGGRLLGRKLRISFLAVIVVASLLRPPEAPADPRDVAQMEVERFLDSEYSYCDAKFLAGLWQQDLYESKARIGRKIGWGDETLIEQYLNEAREAAVERGEACSFYETEFSYDDAELLAQSWGSSVEEVKAYVESKVFYGRADIIRDELAGLRGGLESDHDPAELFYSKGFSYCDAELLSVVWQEDAWDAKVRAGNKLNRGDVVTVEESLAEARETQIDRERVCNFYNSEFTYDDAELLANAWGMSVGETKAYIEDKLFLGAAESIRSELGDFRSTSIGAEIEAIDRFWASGFTYCDARLIAAYWYEDIYEAKQTVGDKIQTGSAGWVDREFSEARAAVGSGNLQNFSCNYADEGYTYADMEALAGLWQMGVGDAKVYVEHKLLIGSGDVVKDAMAQVAARSTPVSDV